MIRSTLSTSDNPYNPFTQYDQWRCWDVKLNDYNSEQYMAREASIVDDIDQELEDEIFQDAIDRIIKFDLPIFNNMTKKRVHYVRVYEPQ